MALVLGLFDPLPVPVAGPHPDSLPALEPAVANAHNGFSAVT
jgi:hypothetical protein